MASLKTARDRCTRPAGMAAFHNGCQRHPGTAACCCQLTSRNALGFICRQGHEKKQQGEVSGEDKHA